MPHAEEITAATARSAKATKSLDTMRARILKADEARTAQVAEAATEAATDNREAAEAWDALATHAATHAGACRHGAALAERTRAAGPARGDAMACSTRSGRLPPVGSGLLAGPPPTLPRVADRRHRPSRVSVTPLLEPLDCRTPGRTMGPEPLSRRANMRAAQRMPAPAAPGARLTAPSLTPLERRSCWSPFPPRIRAAGRGARTDPRQDASRPFGPCHVRCPCAPVPAGGASSRSPSVAGAHPHPPALSERTGNHPHNEQEKRHDNQQPRQARRRGKTRPHHRHHLAQPHHGRRDLLQHADHPPFPARTNWDRSPSFGRDDLLTVAKVADIANTRIHELQAEARSAGREAEPEADAGGGGDD